MIEYIPYGKQYIDQDDIDVVTEVMRSDWLTQGPKVKEFEDAIAGYVGCKYAVAYSSGTAALHGAYHASGMQKGDEFITTPISFVATANAGLYCGGMPKFVDIDPKTYCIDIDAITNAITQKTRAIVPVSYAGYPVDIKAIRDIEMVRSQNICIIHDASHAIGARRDGHNIVDYADMTVLSFHPVKHITTGEGGMVLTNDKKYYQKLLLFRNHGITKNSDDFTMAKDGDWYYEMQELGFNYRITDMQCALGISQLKKLDQFLCKRNRIAQTYLNKLSEIDWITLPPSFGLDWLDTGKSGDALRDLPFLHSYHLFPILIDDKIDRRNFFNYMRANNVGVQVHYIPITQQPYYRQLLNEPNAFDNSERFYDRAVSLPMFYSLAENEQLYVIKLIYEFKNFLRGKNPKNGM